MDEIKDILQANPFFANMRAEDLDHVLAGATTAFYVSGEIFFHEGERADRFFVIESGRVAVEAHELGKSSVVIEILGPGDMLGWSWLFEPFVWHFQVHALGLVKVVVLNSAHLLALAGRDSRFGCELMKRTAQVVIHRLHATRKKLLDQYRLKMMGGSGLSRSS